MTTPKLQRKSGAWWLGLWLVLPHLGQAADISEDPPVLDGPFASRADSDRDGDDVALPSGLDHEWKSRQKKHHVGLSIGTARLKLPCIAGMVCRRSGKAITLYAGGDLTQRWGFELAYVRMSNMEYAGSAVRVRGLNLNLLGELPLGGRASLTGRLGTNYARTRMDPSGNPAVATGSERGFGLSYGVGLNWNVSQNWSASTDWNRHELKFVTGRDNVDTANLSLRYRY